MNWVLIDLAEKWMNEAEGNSNPKKKPEHPIPIVVEKRNHPRRHVS